MYYTVWCNRVPPMYLFALIIFASSLQFDFLFLFILVVDGR